VKDYISQSTKSLTRKEREDRYKCPGLDSVAGFYGISHAICDDWKDGRIDTKTDLRRFSFFIKTFEF